ncbi:hypothetical protein P691DRAFT_734685 [Macrolepiota fuliginosa MF-IS2]|uniref:Snurportin-1 n=1 Tax=Macrolepiota fuliginosa MF-IS2 TaxID=1400762 RepID=A0A9P6C1Q4_9AGAR|nr:hypothetical protein P691DRAFT_734685 [Macrolepiota fuliginosa MF-IS2]
MHVDRKASFKTPPTTIRDRLASQDHRRAQALDDQKRRRAKRFDSARNLDQFADLSLGHSDDDEDDNDEQSPISPASVAQYATMIEAYQPPNAISGTLQSPPPPIDSPTKSKNRRRKKKGKNKKPSKWADKCMYAELLEMSEDDPWSDVDGLPNNLESGWVAVGPVPVGKRCLAVVHQSSGVAGVVPNTTLRSRLLGKTLIPRFPSNLPPLTILDCILDANWRENGILHILDVVKWKGQDICDCEAPFRFWWRDTRLAEVGKTTLIPAPYTKSRSGTGTGPPNHYQFPYPTKFIPIPYYTDTSLMTLHRHIIPLVRTPRSYTIDVPNLPNQNQNQKETDGMDVEHTSSKPGIFTFGASENEGSSSHSVDTTIQSDGLLLYVAEASYESGTSPLSSWIPIMSYEEVGEGPAESKQVHQVSDVRSGPLAVFERLVCSDCAKCSIAHSVDSGWCSGRWRRRVSRQICP